MPRVLRECVGLLRRYCPTRKPVVVGWWYRLPWYADACDNGEYYLIRLSKTLTNSARVDVLAHEWAHCMAWSRERTLHGPAMFLAYSRTYRVLIDGWRPRSPMRWQNN